jgi:hypothetical protein
MLNVTYEDDFKIKNKHVTGISTTFYLSTETISSPPQSHETIPLRLIALWRILHPENLLYYEAKQMQGILTFTAHIATHYKSLMEYNPGFIFLDQNKAKPSKSKAQSSFV